MMDMILSLKRNLEEDGPDCEGWLRVGFPCLQREFTAVLYEHPHQYSFAWLSAMLQQLASGRIGGVL